MQFRFTNLWALMLWCQLGAPAIAENAEGEGMALFVAGSTDIPVMPGLIEDLAARVVFDKTDGRIVEARLSGVVTIDDATDFYRESLAQLGWKVADDTPSGTLFCREGERLQIRFVVTEGPLSIDFSLSPATRGAACSR